MLEMLNGLHYAATSAREGKLSQQSLDDQFNLIKETVSKWEDGEKERPLTGQHTFSIAEKPRISKE